MFFPKINAILTSFTVLFFVSCSSEETKAPPPIPDVKVVSVGSTNVGVFTDYVGQVYGQTDVNIQPRVSGWVTGMYFKEGSLVQKGSLLYTIDDQPLLNEVEAAKADVARFQTINENDKSNLNRVKPLAEMNALSQRDLDAANASYNASLNSVEIAKSRLANARINLGYAKITSPITGIIGISKFQVGDYVGALNPNNILNSVSTLGEVRVRFSISENDYLEFIKRIRKEPKSNLFAEVPVQLILGDGTFYDEIGKLQLTNRQIDPATGSIIVQAVFKNTQGILRPGQYVKVHFKTDEVNNAVVVPQQAVNQLQNVYQVFVLTDSNKMKPTNISVGKRVGSNWIVNNGIKVGDKLVILGSTYLNPTMTVNPIMMNWNYDSTSRN